MKEAAEIKKIIDRFQNFVLIPSLDTTTDSLPAATALFYSLKEIGKNTKLLAAKNSATFENPGNKEKEGWTEKNFLISIKDEGAALSQLFYEKTANGLNLYLKTKGKELKKENICFKKLVLEDILVFFGIKEQKQPELQATNNGRKVLIINIDNSLDNKRYGHLNIVKPDLPISEIVFDILFSIDKTLIKERVADSLLQGMVSNSSHWQNQSLAKDILWKISFLAERGEQAKEFLSKKFKNRPLSLFSRLLNKLNINKDKNLGWAILDQKDFSETSSSPKDLRLSLEILSSNDSFLKNFLIIWQREKYPALVKGIFYSSDTNLLSFLAKNIKGQRKGNGILFAFQGESPEKVKDFILSATLNAQFKV